MSQHSFDPFSIDDDDDDNKNNYNDSSSNNNNSGCLQVDNIISASGATSKMNRKLHGKTNGSSLHSASNSISTNTTSKLPARLSVSLVLHEEVSSTTIVDSTHMSGNTSQLDIEGKVLARIDSSNANDNAPFCVRVSGSMSSLANIKYTNHCLLLDDRTNDHEIRCKVHIPKSELAGCEIFSYNLNVRTQNMPMLVQSKMAVKSTTCRVSVQIRSNLSNRGDISNLVIIIAVPNTLRGETVHVTRGKHGTWDATKRIVKWEIGNLPHGESCLVSAEAEVSSAVVSLFHEDENDAARVIQEKVHCPVLVRCSSEMDQVSNMCLSVTALPDVPANIARVHQVSSYRLLHRV